MRAFFGLAAVRILFSAAFGNAANVVQSAVEDDSISPLKKVVTLLSEMKAQVEKEAEQDDLAYNKYSCWCTTTDSAKTAAIEEASTQIDELTAFIGEAAAKDAQLKTEVETLASDIQEDTDALAQATAIREKEKAAFEAEEAELSETLDALKKAIEVLSKVQLLQSSGSASLAVAPEANAAASALMQVKQVVTKRFPQFEEVMKHDLFDMLGSLQAATASSEDFLTSRSKASLSQQPVGAAAGAKSYNTRSGQIFGVLQEMSDEFTRDLKSAQEEEAKALGLFEKLKEAKEGEITAATEQNKAKEAAIAQLAAKNAEAKRDKAATEKTKAADEAFLADLKEGCAKESEEYNSRVSVRSEEVKALGEALTILTDDDSRTLFGKTMAGFLQVSDSSSSSEERRLDQAAERAMRRLATIAKKHKNWALASLAVRTRLDAFTKVKEAMDKMTAELEAQQKEEYEKVEFCKAEIDKTEDEIKVKKIEQSDLSEKHLDLTNTLSVLSEEMAQLKKDVASMEVSLKEAGENRKIENAAFQTSIADQRATIEILNKALARLEAFYGSAGGAALVQVRVHSQRKSENGASEAPPPPKDYTKHAGAGGVLQLMAMIIKDAESAELQIKADEQSAQETYATFAKNTAASMEADRAAILEKEAQTAEAESEKSETEEAQSANTDALAKASDVLAAHHLDCDWLLKYFDVRKQARAEELDAIANAKAILSGSDFGKAAS